MPKLIQRLGLREHLRETEVIDAWSKIVGDFIAAHSAERDAVSCQRKGRLKVKGRPEEKRVKVTFMPRRDV